MNNKIIYDKSCLSCKLISGTLFSAFAVFQTFRVIGIWNHYPRREKIFNVFAIGLIGFIAALNYNAAY
jgi:hypothetical protein